MSDTETTLLDHCTGRQLKELLRLASTATTASRNWLLEVGDTEELESLIAEVCRGTGQSVDGLLSAVGSPGTPLDSLIAIKRTAKRLTMQAEGPAQKAALTLLYHLSIASALAYHARNISSKQPSERLPLYQDLAAELPDDQLAAVFAKAVTAIRAWT